MLCTVHFIRAVKLKRRQMGAKCSMRKTRNSFKILVGRLYNGSLKVPTRRWDDTIKMDLRERCELAQDKICM